MIFGVFENRERRREEEGEKKGEKVNVRLLLFDPLIRESETFTTRNVQRRLTVMNTEHSNLMTDFQNPETRWTLDPLSSSGNRNWSKRERERERVKIEKEREDEDKERKRTLNTIRRIT